MNTRNRHIKQHINEMKQKIRLILLAILPAFSLSCEDDSTDNGLQVNLTVQSEQSEYSIELIEKLQSLLDSHASFTENLAELLKRSRSDIRRGITMQSVKFSYTSSDDCGNSVTLSAVMAYPAGRFGGPVHSVSSAVLAMPRHLPDEESVFSETGSPMELRASLYNDLVVIPDVCDGTSDYVLSARQALDALDYAVRLAGENPDIALPDNIPVSIVGFGSNALTACTSAMMIDEGYYHFRYAKGYSIKSVICAQTELPVRNAGNSALFTALKNWEIRTPVRFLHIIGDETAPYSALLNFRDFISTVNGNRERIGIIRKDLQRFSSNAVLFNTKANLYWLSDVLTNKVLEY